MEKVNGKKLYHVHRIGNNTRIKIDDTIVTSAEYNPFFKDYDLLGFPMNVNQQKLLNYYWHFARETAIEEVRLNVNPELPSRQKCLWLSDIKALDYWMCEVGYNPKEFQVLELELDGILFKCDATFIEGRYLSLNDVRGNAFRYWSGEILNNNKTEYLFQGTAKVIHELNFVRV